MRGRVRTTLLCAASAGSVMLATHAAAQTADTETAAVEQTGAATVTDKPQDIVVVGVRGAARKATQIKRNAAQVLDSIAAEDIGKLPDATISDSLQRITGVQVRRGAGEGTSVNIRGFNRVTTLLNGDEFLGAGAINSVQPNFDDIPASLMAGADVLKSATASLLDGGITGTINLKTRRPFDLPHGLTGTLALEGAYGDATKKLQPQTNGLLAYHGDGFGALIAGSYSKVTQANFYNGEQYAGCCGALASEAHGDAPILDPSSQYGGGNGNGKTNDQYLSLYPGHAALNKTTERERYGLNGSLQADLGGGFEVIADGFFTHQKAYNNAVGLVDESKWQNNDWFTPTKYTDVGSFDGVHELNTVQSYTLASRRLKADSDVSVVKSQSINANLELKYDKGGPFKATLRGTYGKAKQNTMNLYADQDLANGSQWGINPFVTDPQSPYGGQGYFPGGPINPNPNGYSGFPRVTIDYSGKHPVWSGVPDFVNDARNYNLGALSSENNQDQHADLKAIRGDAEYDFNSAVNMQFGGRYSKRTSRVETYDLAAPLYAGNGATDPNGCLVKWQATDVLLNGGGIDGACTAGDGTHFYTAQPYTPITNFPTIHVTDFGPVKGIPGVYAIDPKAMDNVVAFENSLNPGHVRVYNPGSSYRIGVTQKSGYVQFNYNSDDFVANGGVRVINTQLRVTQNLVGAAQAYGLANLDAGDLVTKRSFTDYLPAFNIAYSPTDSIKLRGAFARTMSLLDLNQWGGALTPSYAICTQGPPTCPSATPTFIVLAASEGGNPNLDPYRASNVDVSAEWYFGQGGMLSIGAYYIKVDSFIVNGTERRALPDQDGVVRREVDVSTLLQGKGGTLKGIEAAFKDNFSFLPGIFKNFGVDTNFTYSPSSSGNLDITGKKIGFPDNSKYNANATLYYQDKKLQVRVAYNYRSRRVAGVNAYGGTPSGITYYQAPTSYVDASVSYDVFPFMTVYVQGSNLTNEYEQYYYQFKSAFADQNVYERRFVGGVRLRF